ncbi:GntR family transcriptional regulator [Thermoactinospora rubra]|uniref:GntR family transcriptional regulator n=1 Tax=Thermoactinospora rubra TaxID=1088767 RepID=UPI000A117F0F|nr:GntR family transcriptional regulator [Thermoactinospora rubra]
MGTSDPVYLRVVEDIRRQINDGTLPPGAPIPSRAQLTRKYQVGETAARHALRVLANEGLIVGRVGSGHYVRERPDLIPLHRWRHLEHPSPFAADLLTQGRRVAFDRHSEVAEAGPVIGARLRLEESARVARTHYVYRDEGKAVQLVTSYEPVELAGDDDRRSVIARMYAHGIKISEIVESVHTRVPQPAESDALALPAGVHVLHVERTHWAGDRPVETSDIVIPGDRFRVVYSLPL